MIETDSTWKISNAKTPDADWVNPNFDDSEWSDYTGESTVTKTGTVYLRKKVNGMSNMVAYEYTFSFQHGIIAYVNGKEVYRANMPSGAVTASTKCSSKFESREHHSVIRNGLELEGSSIVIAMELHYDDNTSSHSFFQNSFLAPYLASKGEDCYQSYETHTISSNSEKTKSDTDNPWEVFDFNPNTAWTEENPNKWLAVTWESWIPQINGFMINVGSQRLFHPSSFTLRGYPEGSSSSDLLVTKVDMEYPKSSENYFALPLNEKIYKEVRMLITKTGSSTLRFNELALLTCRYAVPEKMEFTEDELVLNAYVDEVMIAPKYDGFVQCTVSPPLPNGLNLNYQTCAITGTPRAPQQETVYTITATKPTSTSTTIKITVTTCEKTILEIRRTYPTNSYMYETHWLRDAADNTKTVERVYANTIQASGKVTSNRYCVDSGKYNLAVDNTVSDYWQPESYIDLNILYMDGTYTNILHYKYDITAGNGPDVDVNINMEIPRSSEWSYMFDEVPEDWNSASMPTGWSTSTAGEFPEATNQLQFYKRQFSLSSDPAGAAYELELRYVYGAVVVINGIEVFRNRVPEGPVTNETYATGNYPATMYRRISLPVSLPAVGDTPRQDVIRKGDNVIAVALVAQTAVQNDADFDLSLHVLARNNFNRVFDFTATTSESGVDANLAFDQSGQTVFTSTTCSETRHLTIAFKNDRREWISRYAIVNHFEREKLNIKGWQFQAKNEEDSDWVTLDTVTSTVFSTRSEAKEVYVYNIKPYNSYRLYKMVSEDSTQCEVNIAEFGLYTDSLVMETPAFAYNGNPTGYLDVDFEKIQPNSPYYKHFTINPELPSFMTMDALTGVITGNDLQSLQPTSYTITGSHLTGESVSTNVTISVIPCDKSMVQLTIYTDAYPAEMGWALYAGKDASSTPIASKNGLPNNNAYEYKYFCLDNGIYTFKFTDSWGDGWAPPAGYRIRNPADGYQVYAEGTVPRGTAPVEKLVTFASTVVLAAADEHWRVFKQAAPSGWNTVNFDHSTWNEVTSGNAGKFDAETIYFRHLFTVDDIQETPVLNVVMYFAGGAAVYLNGNRVFRVNLPTQITAKTEATASHSQYAASEFAVPLQLKGGQNGNNVLAVELHRSKEDTAEKDTAFMVRAVLSYGECATMRSSVQSYQTTNTVKGAASSLFDKTVWGFTSWDWVDGTYVSWEFENQDGLMFNQYRFYYEGSSNTVTWDLKGKREGEEVYTTVDAQKSVVLEDRKVFAQKIPNGIIGYKDFHLDWMNVQRPTGFTIDEIEFGYCPGSGPMCPGVGDYPAVHQGELSVSTCPQFYDGYSYRECNGQMLGEVKLDRCKKYAPQSLTFEEPIITVYVDANVNAFKPTVFGLVDDFQIMPQLPEGFTFDVKTGTIGGKPTKAATKLVEYTVTGYNENGSASGTFKLSIITGYCDPEEIWPRTPIGETAVYDCKEKGTNYYGTIKRTCKLGKSEPEWGLEVGLCIASNSFVGIVVGVVVVIIIVIIAAMKVVSDKKKERARTGVRGGKKALNIMKSVPYAKI